MNASPTLPVDEGNAAVRPPPRASPHICLLGVTRNTNNYGVRVLLSGAVDALAATHRETAIKILDYGREASSWTEHTSTGAIPVTVINLRYSWRIHLQNNIFRLLVLVALSRVVLSRAAQERFFRRNPWLAQVSTARVCYTLAGGDSFSDIYGISRLLYVALPQVLVLLMGRRLVQLPQTYGPFRGHAARGIARYLLARSARISSRDHEGVNVVRELLGDPTRPVDVIPDLGFLMRAADPNPDVIAATATIPKGRPLVGLNISKLLHMGGYDRRNMFGLREDYAGLMDRLIEHLIRELDASVLLIPHVIGGTESEESELILNASLLPELKARHGDKVTALTAALEHTEVKAVIGKCDLFIGARMHACIGAVSQAVPTIALAYSRKFSGVMDLVGEGVTVVDLRTAGLQEVTTAVRLALESRKILQAGLRQRIPELKTRIHSILSESIGPGLSRTVE